MGDGEKQEKFSIGGTTYVGPVKSRYGRLSLAIDAFRREVEWLTGYLFVVCEYCGGEDGNGIPPEAAVSYLDAVPEVVTDVGEALLKVEELAADLRGALARQTEERRATEGEQGAKGEAIDAPGEH